MRPIFETERDFLSRELGIEIPSYCWTQRRLIYCNGEKFLKFTVKDNKVILAKDHRKEEIEYKAEPFHIQAEQQREHIEELTKEAIQFINKLIDKGYINNEGLHMYKGESVPQQLYSIN